MSDIQTILHTQRSFYNTGRTKDLTFRITQLKKLKALLKENEYDILAALKSDLNKSPFEAYETEIGMVLGEIDYALKHLAEWTKPKRVRTPIMHFLSSSRIYTEPYGVVLIMSPWNYPVQLTLSPLVGAIAAGNCSVLKPSEYSPHTAALLERLLSGTYHRGYISVIRGGRTANQALLDQKFDYIFFTGSVPVGKVVMEAASKHLTPVTLELGGKSPCLVDSTADIDLAAKRIVWGKFLNAGQTCVAPDYILAERSIKTQLIQALAKYIHSFYGADPLTCQDYPRIISEKHYRRLLELLDSGTVIEGGQHDPASLRIAPTLLTVTDWDSPIMQEEIFGPLLPVLEYDRLKSAIALINSRPKPLAFYYFTTDKRREAYALRTASFGGGCINDTIIHLSNPNLMFGGVGESGMGQYHGYESFLTFSHRKSVIRKSNAIDIPLRYPPFKDHLKLLRLFMH